ATILRNFPLPHRSWHARDAFARMPRSSDLPRQSGRGRYAGSTGTLPPGIAGRATRKLPGLLQRTVRQAPNWASTYPYCLQARRLHEFLRPEAIPPPKEPPTKKTTGMAPGRLRLELRLNSKGAQPTAVGCAPTKSGRPQKAVPTDR